MAIRVGGIPNIAIQARFIRTCCNLDSPASNETKNRALNSPGASGMLNCFWLNAV
jgi:hypothetical protein